MVNYQWVFTTRDLPLPVKDVALELITIRRAIRRLFLGDEEPYGGRSLRTKYSCVERRICDAE